MVTSGADGLPEVPATGVPLPWGVGVPPRSRYTGAPEHRSARACLAAGRPRRRGTLKGQPVPFHPVRWSCPQPATRAGSRHRGPVVGRWIRGGGGSAEGPASCRPRPLGRSRSRFDSAIRCGRVSRCGTDRVRKERPADVWRLVHHPDCPGVADGLRIDHVHVPSISQGVESAAYHLFSRETGCGR